MRPDPHRYRRNSGYSSGSKGWRVAGSVLQDANTQASTAVDVAVKVAAGETVEERYDVPFQLITIDNVDEYIEQ